MCRACVGDVFSAFNKISPRLTRRNFMAMSVAGAAVAAGGVAMAATGTPAGIDTILHGGTVLPAPGRLQAAEALALSGGKIVGVGSSSDMLALQSAGTKLVDLGGRTVLPGFIDPHHHITFSALFAAIFTDVGYTVNRTRAELIAALRKQAAQTPPGKWVVCYNFDNLLQGGDLSMAELDTVSTAHPVLVWYINMHDAAGNSLAFKTAQIPDNVGLLPGGGHFGRGPDGKLNGLIFEEPALKRFLPYALPKITPTLAGKAILDWCKLNASFGTTTFHEPGALVTTDQLEAYSAISAETACRVSVSLMYESMKSGDVYKAYRRAGRAAQVPNTRLSLYGIKIVGDGSNQTKTGAQTIPYLGTQEKGSPNYDPAELRQMVADVKKNNYPVLIHCNGDSTIDNALDAIEAAYGTNHAMGMSRIEHCTMARPDQIERMRRLGVQPSFLMNHVYFYGAAYRDALFGPERTARMDPAGDCVRGNLPFTLHTDSPCSNIGTLQLVQTAVTRRCVIDGSIIGPDQAISLDEALKSVTINAAAQIGMDDRIGTLENGKEADLTILEGNPYKTAPDQIMKIKISETWVGGNQTFKA